RRLKDALQTAVEARLVKGAARRIRDNVEGRGHARLTARHDPHRQGRGGDRSEHHRRRQKHSLRPHRAAPAAAGGALNGISSLRYGPMMLSEVEPWLKTRKIRSASCGTAPRKTSRPSMVSPFWIFSSGLPSGSLSISR